LIRIRYVFVFVASLDEQKMLRSNVPFTGILKIDLDFL
jgi:hypothetical protein